jgi:hypothetical protein
LRWFAKLRFFYSGVVMHDPHHHIALTEDEVADLLEPIEGHGHCWGMIAQSIINSEIERRNREASSKKLGPYGDWPIHGH